MESPRDRENIIIIEEAALAQSALTTEEESSSFKVVDEDLITSRKKMKMTQDDWQPSASASACTPNSSTSSGIAIELNDSDCKVCRICHNGSSEESLISPCKCCGSAKYAHQSCLMAWFGRKKDKICELCLYEVKLVKKGFKSPTRWKLPRRSCDFVTCLFMFYCLVLIAFISMVMWVASNGCMTTVCVVLYFVSVVSLIYFSYCCGFMRQIVEYWTSCLELNREVVMLSRTESKTTSSVIEIGVIR